MESILFVGGILAIHVFAWFTPGPMTVLIVRNSLLFSRRTGVWTAAGISLANFVHITYSVVAITLLVSTSDFALVIIRVLGVGYLAYLGLRTLFAKSKAEAANTSSRTSDISAVNAAKIGFLANTLNPNAALFFAGIFATVLSSGLPTWVTVFLWVAMPLNSFVTATLLSIFFSQNVIRSLYTKYERAANILLGGALLLLALVIALNT